MDLCNMLGKNRCLIETPREQPFGVQWDRQYHVAVRQ